MILVLVNGGPLSLEWELEHMDAVLEAWYGGEEGGNAVAEAIFGDYSPAGKWCIRVALAAVG